MMGSYKKLTALFVAMLGVTIFLTSSRAYAFSNTFPDLSDTAGGANVYAVSANDRYVQQTDGKVRVWFPSNSGSVTIKNGHYCSSNAYDTIETSDGSWASYANGSNVTRFRASGGGITTTDKFGKKFAAGDGRCNNDITFNFSGITSRENGWYYVNIDVDYVADANPSWDGGMNYWRMVASNGAKIGIPGDTSGYTTTQEQVDTSPLYTDYYAVFGTPCDATSAQTARVTLYDLDNAGGSGAQPTSGPPVQVRVKNLTTGNYVNFAGSTGTTWTPPDTQNNSQSITFTAQPDYKYRLELLNVYYNNTIQYSVPYSQIYRQECPHPPTGSVGASTCSVLSGVADDQDMPNTARLRVKIVVDGSTTYYVNTAVGGGAWSFSTITQDFRAHTYAVTALGKDDANTEDGANSSLGTPTIGPCAKVRCGTPTISVGQPEPSQGFTISFVLPYTNHDGNGSVANPMPVAGRPTRPVHKLVLSGLVNDSNAAYTTDGDSVNFTTGSISKPTAGSYTLTWSFTRNGSDITIGSGTCSTTIMVVLKPVVKAYGGDVAAGGSFVNAGACTIQTSSIVSWPNAPVFNAAGTTVAAFASGNIRGFATAVEGSPVTNPPGGLAFANTAPSGERYGGGFGVLPCIADYWGTLPPSATVRTTVPDLATTANGSYKVTNDASLATNVTLPTGKRVTVYVDGDLRITGTGAVAYNRSGWTTLGDIPALKVIVKGDIYIDAGVRELNGVYIAQPINASSGGNIYTCVNAATGTPYSGIGRFDNCQTQLTINGAFAAKRIHFDRTYGTAFSGTIAEKFNYLPELWLGQSPGGSVGTAAKYDAIVNLPPLP